MERKAKLRRSLKKEFSYPVFLYEAESVGITATGEDDANELYPNNNQPTNITKTCLDLYREFLINPDVFLRERLS
jgi:type I restriction enzyme M protein